MIERHYFRDELIKSFDFTFAFCIPGSTNTWETVYETPPLPDESIDAIVANPFETRSDTFYFVGQELVMHHKVSYKYVRNDQGRNAVAGAKEVAGDAQTESKYGEEDEFSRAIGEAKITEDSDEDCIYQAESKERTRDDAGNKSSADDCWSKDVGY